MSDVMAAAMVVFAFLALMAIWRVFDALSRARKALVRADLTFDEALSLSRGFALVGLGYVALAAFLVFLTVQAFQGAGVA